MNPGYFSLFKAQFLSGFWVTMSDRCMFSYVMAYLSFPDDILLRFPLLHCTWLAKYEFSRSCYILSWNATCCTKKYIWFHSCSFLFPSLTIFNGFQGLTVSVWRRSIFRRVCKIAESDHSLRHVCPSVRPDGWMEQLGSHWTDFHEIWYLSTFRKLVKRIQVSVRTEDVEKIKTHILFSVPFFENHATYEIIWKNTESRAGHRWQYGASRSMPDN